MKRRHNYMLGAREPGLNIRILCGIAIVGGLTLEILRIGSQFSLGTIIAGIGIIVFVYDYMRPKPR